MKIVHTLVGVVAGIALGSTGCAVATEAFNGPPPSPTWMTRNCQTPDRLLYGDCYWNPTAPGGPAPHFEHTFRVQDDQGRYTKVDCYAFSDPQNPATLPKKTVATRVDHCVSHGVWQHASLGWIDPHGTR